MATTTQAALAVCTLAVPDSRKPFYNVSIGVWCVPLTRGRVALIDEQDVLKVSAFRWAWEPRASGPPERAYRRDGRCGKAIPLSRFIAGAAPGDQVNFANDDGLDCRRSNLRTIGRAKACQRKRKQHEKSSTFKGVSWRKDANAWCARITVDGKQKFLGLYRDEHRAAEAYDEAARAHFGHLARLNFPA